MPMFRKKPVVVEAEQWFPGIKIEGVVEHRQDTPLRYEPNPTLLTGSGIPIYHYWGTIKTLKGEEVSSGDWIITGVKGKKYLCKPDIFKATYEPVTDVITMGIDEETGKPLTIAGIAKSFHE